MNTSENEEVRGKKRKRQPEKYKRNIIKTAKVSGKEFVNWVGRYVPSRHRGPICGCNKRCCSEIITNKNLDTLNSMQTKDEQDIYLQGLIIPAAVRRKRPREVNPRNRDISFHYFVINDNDSLRTEVCKKAFISIHGVTAKRVRRLCLLLKQSKVPQDMRGKNVSGNAIKGPVLDLIHQHIQSFPTKKSHYSGKILEYLDSRLSVKTMHTFFIAKNPEFKGVIKYYFYLKYFNENFNLKFGRPQIDTCCKCEELGVKVRSPSLGEAAKRTAAAELMVHRRRAKKYFSKIKDIQKLAKENDHVLGLTFDFMQNKPLPFIPVQEVFYLRQLWVYFFGIHNLKTNDAMFYTYHEGEAKKSPNEVCSFLRMYINEYVPDTVTELHLFADGCGGQNKNHTVIRFLMALVQTGRFKKIVQYFPQRGHSFLPNDRDFGTAKLALKRHDRIYSPEEYASIVAGASEKFFVKMVKTEEVIDFKNWWPTYYKKDSVSIETLGKGVAAKDKQHLGISSYMQFSCDLNQKGVLTEKSFIDGLQTHMFRLAKSGTPPTIPSRRVYHGDSIPINKEKIDDIKKLLKYIPEQHIPFYQKVIDGPSTTEEDIENLDIE